MHQGIMPFMCTVRLSMSVHPPALPAVPHSLCKAHVVVHCMSPRIPKAFAQCMGTCKGIKLFTTSACSACSNSQFLKNPMIVVLAYLQNARYYECCHLTLKASRLMRGSTLPVRPCAFHTAWDHSLWLPPLTPCFCPLPSTAEAPRPIPPSFPPSPLASGQAWAVRPWREEKE